MQSGRETTLTRQKHCTPTTLQRLTLCGAHCRILQGGPEKNRTKFIAL